LCSAPSIGLQSGRDPPKELTAKSSVMAIETIINVRFIFSLAF
jgi:hypothetical protein